MKREVTVRIFILAFLMICVPSFLFASSDFFIPEYTEEYKEWLTFARMDFESAKYLDGAPFHPRPLNVICYHCQQAGEKGIKAVIVATGAQGGMPKLHDLAFLLDQVKNMVEIDDKYYDYADELTPYAYRSDIRVSCF